MVNKWVRKYMSELGKVGGTKGGATNKQKGSEYFKAIRAKRKTWNKLGPRLPKAPDRRPTQVKQKPRFPEDFL